MLNWIAWNYLGVKWPENGCQTVIPTSQPAKRFYCKYPKETLGNKKENEGKESKKERNEERKKK